MTSYWYVVHAKRYLELYFSIDFNNWIRSLWNWNLNKCWFKLHIDFQKQWKNHVYTNFKELSGNNFSECTENSTTTANIDEKHNTHRTERELTEEFTLITEEGKHSYMFIVINKQFEYSNSTCYTLFSFKIGVNKNSVTQSKNLKKNILLLHTLF